jgi:hypothetical protein
LCLLVFLDVVKDDDPTNNVPDNIFSKLGMQLHRRDQHPLGIIKNAIYDYFDTNYSNKFNKFDDLCPIVSLKQVWKNTSNFCCPLLLYDALMLFFVFTLVQLFNFPY